MHIKNLILTYRWVVNNFIIFTIKNLDKSMFLIWYKYKYCKIGTAEYDLYFTCVPWKVVVWVFYRQKNKAIRLCFHLVETSIAKSGLPNMSYTSLAFRERWGSSLSTKKQSHSTLFSFGRTEWTRTTDPHLIRVVL